MADRGLAFGGGGGFGLDDEPREVVGFARASIGLRGSVRDGLLSAPRSYAALSTLFKHAAKLWVLAPLGHVGDLVIYYHDEWYGYIVCTRFCGEYTCIFKSSGQTRDSVSMCATSKLGDNVVVLCASHTTPPSPRGLAFTQAQLERYTYYRGVGMDAMAAYASFTKSLAAHASGLDLVDVMVKSSDELAIVTLRGEGYVTNVNGSVGSEEEEEPTQYDAQSEDVANAVARQVTKKVRESLVDRVRRVAMQMAANRVTVEQRLAVQLVSQDLGLIYPAACLKE